MALTDQERARIHETLEATGGDRQQAADILGMDVGKLKDTIHASPPLKAKWAVSRLTPQPPAKETFIDRKSATVDKKKGDIKSLRESLSKIGTLELDDIEQAVGLWQFYDQHATEAMGIIGGGMTETVLHLRKRLQDLGRRMDQGFDGDNALEEERMCWDAYLGLAEIFRKSAVMANDAIVKKALIALKQKEMNADGSQKRAKPGFGPPPLMAAQKNENKIEIHAAPGSSVSIQEPQPPTTPPPQ